MTEQILRSHAARYPHMQPQDGVKLIYQNEFGGGHLIRDIDSCLNYLRREYESVVQSPDAPLTEDIGNGMVRVYLNALDHAGYPIEQLGADFIRSANARSGSLDSRSQIIGLIDSREIVGTAIFVLFPGNDDGNVKRQFDRIGAIS